MRNRAQVTTVVVMAAALWGCSAGSARREVGAAERQIQAIQESAQKIAPDRLKALTDSLEAIKARIEAGETRAAVMSARSVTTQARDLAATLETTRSQLETAFRGASGEIPGQLERVQARISELSAMRRLPPNINAANFAALRAEAANWPAMWEQATKDFSEGNLAKAMSQANTLRRALASAQNTLAMQ